MIRKVILLVCLLSSVAVYAQDFSSYNMKRVYEALENDNYSQAEQYLVTELESYPKNGYAWYCASIIEMEMEEYGDALTAINNSLTYLPKKDKVSMARAFVLRAQLYYDLDNAEAALNDYSKALKYNPNEELVYQQRAQLYYELGEYDLSDEDYKKLIYFNEGNPYPYLCIGRNAAVQERYEDAIAIFDYILKLDKGYARAYTYRAQCYTALEKYSLAIDDIVTAIELRDTKIHNTLYELADLSLTELVAKLKVKCIKEKNSSFWPSILAIVYEQVGQYEQAIEQYKIATKIDKDAVVLSRIAMNYDNLEEFPLALDYINCAIELDSTECEFSSFKANVLYEMGRGNDAVELMGKYIDCNPEYHYGYYRRAWYKNSIGDADGAIEDYTMSIVLKPNYTYAYLLRADIYALKGDTELSKKDYEMVIKLDTVPSFNSCTHFAYQSIGEKEKAIDFINRIIELDTTYAVSYYDLACLYSRMGEKDKAIEALRMSFEKGYRSFSHIDNDYDLNNLRTMPEFIELYNTYKQKYDKRRIIEKEDKEFTEEIVEVPFTQEGGVYKVKCSINNLPLYFIFDTGASVVSISNLDAAFMFKNNYLSQKDIEGTQRFSTADGNISEGTIINLNKVEFGGLSLTNIKASVVNSQQAPLLLGQSVLKKLGRYEIDNDRKVIKIHYKKFK